MRVERTGASLRDNTGALRDQAGRVIKATQEKVRQMIYCATQGRQAAERKIDKVIIGAERKLAEVGALVRQTWSGVDEVASFAHQVEAQQAQVVHYSQKLGSQPAQAHQQQQCTQQPMLGQQTQAPSMTVNHAWCPRACPSHRRRRGCREHLYNRRSDGGGRLSRACEFWATRALRAAGVEWWQRNRRRRRASSASFAWMFEGSWARLGGRSRRPFGPWRRASGREPAQRRWLMAGCRGGLLSGYPLTG